mmetsp:Transcript_23323/g.59451  ORF Transcript_23323/g.59451 Transcript_23323/m.59451 type:complete len:317 (+) Transcript_23323:468-1418(+)
MVGGRDNLGGAFSLPRFELLAELHRVRRRDDLQSHQVVLDAWIARLDVGRQLEQERERVVDLHLAGGLLAALGCELLEGGVAIAFRQEERPHLLATLHHDEPIDHVPRHARSLQLARLGEQQLRGARLGGVRHELPDHCELAVRHLIAQPGRQRLQPREAEGAIEVCREDLGTRRGAIRRLEDSREHALRLIREDEHERRLIARAELVEEGRAALVGHHEDWHLCKLGLEGKLEALALRRVQRPRWRLRHGALSSPGRSGTTGSPNCRRTTYEPCSAEGHCRSCLPPDLADGVGWPGVVAAAIGNAHDERRARTSG